MEDWTLADALDNYGIHDWGNGYFTINEGGNLCVTVNGALVDLKQLVDELRDRGIEPPVLIRLLDIIEGRAKRINDCFGA